MLSLTSSAAAAQEGAARSRVWLGIGLAGGTGARVESGFGPLIQPTFQKGSHHATVRALGLLDLDPGSVEDGLGEIGLLYGRASISSWGHAALSTGLSFVRLDHCPGKGREPCNTVGVPLTAEAAVQTVVAGMGLQLFATVTPKTLFGGVVLFLQIGWMP